MHSEPCLSMIAKHSVCLTEAARLATPPEPLEPLDRYFLLTTFRHPQRGAHSPRKVRISYPRYGALSLRTVTPYLYLYPTVTPCRASTLLCCTPLSPPRHHPNLFSSPTPSSPTVYLWLHLWVKPPPINPPSLSLCFFLPFNGRDTDTSSYLAALAGIVGHTP